MIIQKGTGPEDDETRSRKIETSELETTRRASLIYEESRQMRASEVAARASSSKIIDIEKNTSEGAFFLRTLLMVSLQQREWVPRNRTRHLVDLRRYAPYVCFTYHFVLFFYICIGDNFMLFCWGGVNGK